MSPRKLRRRFVCWKQRHHHVTKIACDQHHPRSAPQTGRDEVLAAEVVVPAVIVQMGESVMGEQVRQGVNRDRCPGSRYGCRRIGSCTRSQVQLHSGIETMRISLPTKSFR